MYRTRAIQLFSGYEFGSPQVQTVQRSRNDNAVFQQDKASADYGKQFANQGISTLKIW
jgi:hypothetical protein